MKIVLDTNVLVSGLLNPHGIPAQILNLILSKKITLILDTRILSEYSEVLRRKKFNFREEWITPLLDFIRWEGEIIIPTPLNIPFTDPDDRIFLEAAKSGNARFLVTGNIKHFPEDPLIISPSTFMEQFLAP